MPIGGVGSADIALNALNKNAVSFEGVSDVPSDVSVAMLSNSLSQTDAQGAAMTRMMEQSVNPNVGGNIDFYA